MTPEKFAVNMAEIRKRIGRLNEEDTHKEMDDLMARTLEDLGYGDGIKIFDEQKKWYI